MSETPFTIAELLRWAMGQGPSVVALFFVLMRLESKLDEVKKAIENLKS